MQQFCIVFLFVLGTVGILAQDTIIDLNFGKLHHYSDFNSKFVQPRNIDIWIPDNYSPDSMYNVMYFQDGQNLFDPTFATSPDKSEWRIDECLDSMYKNDLNERIIVVGIWSTGSRRPEYYPQKPYNALHLPNPENVKTDIGGVPISDKYLKFIVKELKPFVDKKYSTYKTAAHTFIAGSSMGGLLAMYAICEYPKVFGGAACLSTHWVGCPKYRNPEIPSTFLAYLKKNCPSLKTHKFYFDNGTEGLEMEYNEWQIRANFIMFEKWAGYKNCIIIKGLDQGHNEKAWASRVSSVLMFFFQPWKSDFDLK
jgi:predicted alpha/beta superfamily hydrolase